MAISIKDPETDRLARELAAATGVSLTEAIREALQERLARESQPGRHRISAEVRRIQERLAALPVLDTGTPDDILGYDADGLPN